MNDKITMEIYKRIKEAIEKRMKVQTPVFPDNITFQTVWQNAREAGMLEALQVIAALGEEDDAR